MAKDIKWKIKIIINENIIIQIRYSYKEKINIRLVETISWSKITNKIFERPNEVDKIKSNINVIIKIKIKKYVEKVILSVHKFFNKCILYLFICFIWCSYYFTIINFT